MNSPQPRLPWSEIAQPRSWPLPVKLVAVVAVPALFAITLGTLRVLDQSGVADDFDQVNRVAALQEEYSQLAVELEDERDQAVQFVAVRDRQDQAPFDEATEATDRARTEATDLLGDQSDLNSGTVGALRQVDNNYFRLTQLRRQVLTGANDATDLAGQYNLVIEPLLVFDSALTRQLSLPEVSGLSQAIGALGEARAQVSLQQSVVTAVLDGGALLDGQADALRAADSRLATATSTIRSILSDEQQARYTAFAGSVAATREQLKQSVVDRGRAELPLEVDPQAWTAASQAVLTEIDTAEVGARTELRDISATQQDAASNRAGISSVFLLLAILLGAGIVYLVAKALINSLRTLRRAALDVAERRLPEAVQSMREGGVPDVDVAPVPVTTREEIGQVARAFDAVHGQAVRLAAEQATLQSNVSSMFANLSRRSQALAERQLKLIEELESNEQDPDQLSNLFQLDSLATRMRRNSENLLVLSGTDLSKRATQPVPVVDVLRAAVSEVEQYQRVVVQSPPDATIAGRAASDIVHLLAELVDNATNFSAPETQVVMSSQRTPDGSVLIEITDRGVGMVGDEVTDANDRLARPTALDVSVSRRMGLFVVGRLAARHGLGVHLDGGTPGSGTTASVTVPGFLVMSAPGVDLGGPARPAGPPAGPPAPSGRDFVPTARPGVNGTGRPAPLSALVAGADAPVGSPGGPLPGTPIPMPQARTATTDTSTQGAPANGRGPAGNPAPGDLPTRRPGQLLGQVPSAAPPATDRPRNPDPDGDRPQPAIERSGPQRPTPGRAPEPAPATEAFPAQQATAAGGARTTAPGGTGTQPQRPGERRRAPDGDVPGERQHTTQGGDVRPDPSERQRAAQSGDVWPDPSERQRAAQSGDVWQSPPQPVRPAAQARPAPAPPQAEASSPALPVRRPAEPSSPSQPRATNGQGAAPRPGSAPAGPRAKLAPAPLFAPGGEPAEAHAPAQAPAGDSGQATRDPSETTPIFEEIASAWFRDERPVPLPYDRPAPDGEPRRAALPTRTPAPVPPTPTPRPSPGTQRAPLPAPPRPAEQPAPAPEPPPRAAPQPQAPARPVTVGSAAGSAGHEAPSAFSTAADDGWRASAAAAELAEDEITRAGLPKRRPRARLVPGAASSAVPGPSEAVPAAAPARTAEAVRGRLSSYQDGVRQGREIRMRRAAAGTNGNPNEEQR